MFYVINGWIKFSPEDSQLSSMKDEDIMLTLSNQTTRLLMEFVKNSDEVLSKDYLLKSVWEDFGLTPSSNNLYSATSELRKAFNNLGETEAIIKTIPKVGFQFLPTITTPEIEKKEKEESQQKEKNVKKPAAISVMIVALLTAGLVAFYLNASPEIEIKKQETTFTMNIDKCRVYTIGGATKTTPEQITQQLSSFTNMLNTCKTQKYDIFYGNTGGMNIYTFIGSCVVDEDNRHSKCINSRML
ncbi:winged helix-turn-helix domain-containing protein [Serratia marcescens]